MAVSYNFAGPRIVKDGLVLYLDAGNPNSYNLSTPNVWRDISKNKHNGTLVNGTQYTSTTVGNVLRFDGADDYISIPNFASLALSPACTISIWSYIRQNKGYHFWGNEIFLVEIQSNQTYRVRFNLDGNWRTSYTTNYPLNIWHKLDITWDGTNTKIYINSVEAVSSTEDSAFNLFSNTINQPLVISNRDANYSYSNVDISQIQIYNRALSQAEITQNFNATRERFEVEEFTPLILPNLHVWLDPSDATTTWQDVNATVAAISDNDPVARINDKSNNGYHYTVEGVTQRPLLKTGVNGENNLNSLLFDGSDDILIDKNVTANAAWANISFAYMFAVLRDSVPTAGDGWHMPIHVTRNNPSPNTRMSLTTRTNNTNTFGGVVRLNNGTLFIISTPSDNGLNILSYISEHSLGRHFLRKNGSQVATNTFTPDNFFNASSPARSLGGQTTNGTTTNSGFRFNGKIGEVIIGTGQLTTAQRDAIETYLIKKWGL